jgi:hypothetical protein
MKGDLIMAVTVTLTKKQLQKIQEDMDDKIEMLTGAEIDAIAQAVNKAINLPFLSEEQEFIIFVKVIKWIDRQLYKLLPNEYYELVKDASNGISKEEAIKIEERLTPLINNVINIPIISEKQEAKLIGLILGLIIKAMVKGFKLEEAQPT